MEHMISNHSNPVLEDKQPPSVKVTDGGISSGLTDEDIFFAKERYKLHQSTPEEGVDINIIEKYFFKKYGF